MKTLILSVISALSIAISGCAATSQSAAGIYTGAEAKRQQPSHSAWVVATKPVLIEEDTNGLGLLLGAVTGGLAGKNIGGGSGSDVAAVLGGIGGAVLGAKMEQKAKTVAGLEIIVMFADKSTSTIVQAQDGQEFLPGDKVIVVQLDGKSRVTK